MNMLKLTIDEVCPKGDDTPVVLDFLHAYPTEAMKSLPCTTLLDTTSNEKVYAFEIDDMLYTAREVSDKRAETVLVKRNKKSGKVTVVGTTYAEVKPELLHDLKEADEGLTTDILELSRKFGSKKHKQQMEQKEKLKVNIETVTEQMVKVTSEIKEDQVDLSAYTNNDADNFYVPPINRTAQNAKDVYDVDKILTEEQYDKIYSQLETKDYISDMLPWLQGLLVNKKLSSKLTVLAVYANSLLYLYSTVAKEISKKNFVTCQHSPSLHEIIMKNFTSQTNGKILRPGPYKDKSLCYAIVLILLVNDLKFDLNGFCEALKLTVNNASMKIRTTGATVLNSGGKKTVLLKIPLNNKPGFRRKSAKF